MRFKKVHLLFFSTLFLIYYGRAVAGGAPKPPEMPMPEVFQKYFYVQGFYNAYDNERNPRTLQDFGVDFGYRFSRNFAVEIGSLNLPSSHNADFFNGGNSFSWQRGRQTTWSAYGAIKGIIPLSQNFDLYGKLGLDYESETINIAGRRQSDYNFSPLYAIGVEYNFKNIVVGTQFAQKYNTVSGLQSIASLSVGFKFNM